MSSEWLEQIVSELREFAAGLLGEGLTRATCKSTALGSLLQQTIRLVDVVGNQVPRLLDDLELQEQGTVAEMVPTVLPRHAVLSRRPSDYALFEGQIIPYRWLRPEQDQVLPSAPLRWMLYVILQLHAELSVHAARFLKQLEVARVTRAGDSGYAVLDRFQLERMLSEVRRGELRMQQILQVLLRRGGRRLSPCRHRPTPFPGSRNWQEFSRIADHLLNPGKASAPWLNDLLSGPIYQADAPFLFQRWCGLQLLRSAERQGWHPSGDAEGALLLGGAIELQQEEKSIFLWVEPRISSRTADVTGWSCVDGKEELTPDFLLVCGKRGRRDAFVLDATLSTSPEIVAAKGKYRNRLQGLDHVVVAGVPVMRRPLRSWSIAPLRSGYCRLGDSEGWTGTIPVHPQEPDHRALDAWMSDVLKHASL